MILPSTARRVIYYFGILLVLALAGPIRGSDHSSEGMAPQQSLSRLIDGNARFTAGASAPADLSIPRIAELAKGQHPFAIIVSCSDSRVPPEHVFNTGLGDLFVIRLAGNVPDSDTIASVEYAAAHLGTRLIVVMGHDSCGAVKATAGKAKDTPAIVGLVQQIAPAVDAAETEGLKDDALIDRAINLNAGNSRAQLLEQSALLKQKAAAGQLKIITARYHLPDGKVQWLNTDGLAITTPTASPVAAASSPAHPAAPAGGHHANGSTTGGASAAESSKIQSTGSYAAPELALEKRTPFGPKSGKAIGVDAIEQHSGPASGVSIVFWIATLLVALATAAVAFSLSSIKSADGATRRALTIGSKLTLSFGALATLILLVSSINMDAQQINEQSAVQIKNMSAIESGVDDLTKDVLNIRMKLKDFLIANTQENLNAYSDAAAAASERIAKLQAVIHEPQMSHKTQEIRAKLEEYYANVDKVAKVIDERNGIVSSRMNPTAARATALITEIMHTAQVDGDLAVALDAAEALDLLQLGRVSAMKYLRTSEETDAKEAGARMEEAGRMLNKLGTEVKNPKRRLWLAEASQACSFYAKRLEETIEQVHARNDLVKNHLDVIGPAIKALTTQFTEQSRKLTRQIEEEAGRATRQAQYKSIVASVIAVLVAVSLALIITRSLSQAVNKLLHVLSSVAAGDLSQPPLQSKSKDEMGELSRATDRMSQSLTKLVSEVSGSAREVASAATEIAASSEEMAAGMTEQNKQVTQISAAIEEMSASVVEVAKKSGDAASNASESGKIATEGGSVVEQTIQGMQAINEAVSASAASVQELGKRGAQIGQIIEVINDIADQTNLLALNAAIEAARAGEHGRGFAVVADEVRKLADRTTKATEEIAESIKAIQTETDGAVQRMQVGTEQVQKGVELATGAGDSLHKIVASAQQVAGMIQSIAAAAEEQSAASEQVSRNVQTISNVTRQASEGAGQAATAASQLSTKAEQLQQLVSQFKLAA